MVQNGAVHLLTRVSKYRHLGPVLASLHWLPVEARADFKVLQPTNIIVNGITPLYLCDLVNLRLYMLCASRVLSVPMIVGEVLFFLCTNVMEQSNCRPETNYGK